ncbi:MAG: carboxylate-amine ligase, partial [Pseudomonadales bacterium]
MEFQLVDIQTQDLVDAAGPMLEQHVGEPYLKPEFHQSSLELASPPAQSLSELAGSVQGLAHDLLRVAKGLGLEVCSAGTHPCFNRSATITPGARYRALEQAAGWLSHHQVTFGTHVHLGMRSGDDAVALMRKLKPYLPVLIALSASSPFWQGEDTRFAAFRHRVLATARSYGTPPDFADWGCPERFLSSLQRAGIAAELHDLHWDIRPSPVLGTLEVRVMDAQPTVGEALALAALVRALVRFLQHAPEQAPVPQRDEAPLRQPLKPVHWWSLKDNCFVASRYGIDAMVVVDDDGRVVALRDVAQTMFRAIAPFAEADETPYLQRLEQTVSGGLPYVRQR